MMQCKMYNPAICDNDCFHGEPHEPTKSCHRRPCVTSCEPVAQGETDSLETQKCFKAGQRTPEQLRDDLAQQLTGGLNAGKVTIEPFDAAYTSLRQELDSAFKQASEGKGKARHADGENFESQKICVIARWIAGAHHAGPLFQAIKKAVESARLGTEAAIHELDGATNYLQACKIVLREKLGKENELE